MTRLIRTCIALLFGSSLLLAQLPNPLGLPDPLGITKKPSTPQAGRQQERQPGRDQGRHKGKAKPKHRDRGEHKGHDKH